MNKHFFLLLSLSLTLNIIGSQRTTSLRRTKRTLSHSLKRSLTEKSHFLTLSDKHGDNEIELSFTSPYEPLALFLEKLAGKLDCEERNIRLRIGKKIYGNQDIEVDYKQDWFINNGNNDYSLDINKLKDIRTENPEKLFYICKLKKNFLMYEDQQISYTKKINPKKGTSTIKFNLKNLKDFESKEVITEIKNLFYSMDTVENDDYFSYNFKFKNMPAQDNHHIIKTSVKNDENLIFRNIQPLHLVFPNIKKGIKYLENIAVFKNNCIGKIEIQDIEYVQEFNEIMKKKEIIALLNSLKERESI